ncbi:MAG: phosphate signaling complex protein PhoU [Methanomassiliicoccus sp.]|nr:phosphate signaling complex protein PhoU [Methanomassiliicoccus sp.]
MTPRAHYNEQLELLHNEVLRMGDLAKDMVKKGVQSFLTSDVELKNEVIGLDHEIYSQEMIIERHCVELIALYQPVASDLRTVTTCLKIITDLNRIGRYGRDIAELSDHHDPDKSFRRIMTIPLMADLATAMVADSINSFVTLDDKAARELFTRDDEVDSLWNTIFRESLTYMIEDPRNITTGTHFILIARYLERIADHACNIGDRVVFMVTGRRLDPYARKGHPPGPDPLDQGRTLSTDGYYSIPLEEK